MIARVDYALIGKGYFLNGLPRDQVSRILAGLIHHRLGLENSSHSIC
jgi:hypothetical protein